VGESIALYGEETDASCQGHWHSQRAVLFTEGKFMRPVKVSGILRTVLFTERKLMRPFKVSGILQLVPRTSFPLQPTELTELNKDYTFS